MGNFVKMNKHWDDNFTLEQIKAMSAEEIQSYNNNPNHMLKIRETIELIFLGVFLPFIILLSISKRTQLSQRKFMWIPHWIAYSIIALIIIIVACSG